jgi:hypothetical protein
MRCRVGDGGWPSGIALQGEVSNHRELLRLRAVVVSVAEKAPVMASGVLREGEQSEPLLKRRKRTDVIETGVPLLPRDEPGGGLLTGQVVTGAEVARARSRHWHETWEPVAPAVPVGCWIGRWKGVPQAAESVRGRVVVRGTGADRLVVAVRPGNAGGAKGTGRPGALGGQPVLVSGGVG